MEINSNFLIYSTQTNQKVSNNTKTTEEITQKDYSKMYIADLKEIPYDEAKNNIEAIQLRLNKIIDNNGSSNETFSLQMSLAYVDDNNKLGGFNNNIMDKTMFETMNSLDTDAAFNLEFNISPNLTNYYNGEPNRATFQMYSQDSIFSPHKNLTKSQMNSINMDEFLNEMLSFFTQKASESNGVLGEQYKQVADGYKTFAQNYQNNKSEPIYA
jgi:hypothetical protein